jgi:competence protein ComZ
MQQENMMQFMQIAMKYMPEAKSFLEKKGIELTMDDMQPLLDLLMNVMNDAYQVGKEE